RSFLLLVSANVQDDVIDAPNPANAEHQKAILEFYKRAFSLLNNFLLRYRIKTFNYMNEPIKWFSRSAYAGEPARFYVKLPLEIERSLEVDDDYSGGSPRSTM